MRPHSCTSLETSVNFSVFRPMSTSYMVSMARASSSYAALPARSPMPLTDVCATWQPSAIAISVLATPIP